MFFFFFSSFSLLPLSDGKKRHQLKKRIFDVLILIISKKQRESQQHRRSPRDIWVCCLRWENSFGTFGVMPEWVLAEENDVLHTIIIKRKREKILFLFHDAQFSSFPLCISFSLQYASYFKRNSLWWYFETFFGKSFEILRKNGNSKVKV